jgi:hypothetical protein
MATPEYNFLKLASEPDEPIVLQMAGAPLVLKALKGRSITSA